MFLAYQRASRPYKRLVFDDFTFFNFYIFFKITILIPSPPRSYRHLAGVRYRAAIFNFSFCFYFSFFHSDTTLFMRSHDFVPRHESEPVDRITLAAHLGDPPTHPLALIAIWRVLWYYVLAKCLLISLARYTQPV